MAIETYQFLNELGVQKLAEQLFGKVNIRIAERIVTSVDANASDKQVASAKALYNLIAALQAKDVELTGRLDDHDTQLTNNGNGIAALNESQAEQDTKISALETNLQDLVDTVNSLTHLTIETVTGDISTVADPQTDVMYLQRDDESDTTWMMYIYQAPAVEGEAGSWINIGDTEVDLSNYWSKDNIEEMKEALGIHDAEAISDDQIVAAVEAAFSATTEDLTDDTESGSNSGGAGGTSQAEPA